MRKGFIAGIIVLILGMGIVPSTGQTIVTQPLPLVRGGWLYVGGSGPGNYSRIQDAIDNASHGDTIYVYSGTYYENLRINMSGITLIGEAENSTVIDGARKDIVVMTRVDSTTIQGFTIQNSSTGMFNDVAIVASNKTNQLRQIHVSECILQKNGRGIYFYNVSDSSITDCRIQDLTAQSIELYCTTNNITIDHCVIHHCGSDMGGSAYSGGISHYGLYNFTGTNIRIINNNITRIGATGIQLDSTINVAILNNTILDCTWWGITVALSTNVSVQYNMISKARKNGIMTSNTEIQIINNRISGNGKGEMFDGGLLIQDSTRNAVVSGNSIETNDPHGLYLIRSPGSTITNNNIMNNTKNAFVFDTPTSHWRGNYWSNWNGLGPIIIKGWLSKWQLPWANLDRHPAKEPYEIPN
jgi:parallel beta-helix repeat protein